MQDAWLGWRCRDGQWCDCQVGGDAYGKMITDELSGDGVDTSRVVVKAGQTSPFTYVLVDTETMTRTCIHTPAEGGVNRRARQSPLIAC